MIFALINKLKNITTALSLGCMVAAGVFLWPGALSAIMGFSVLGYTLGAFVGTGLIHQLAAVAALTAVSLFAADFAVDVAVWAVSGLFKMLASCCFAANDDDDASPAQDKPVQKDSATRMRSRMPAQPAAAKPVEAAPPTHHDSLYPPVRSDNKTPVAEPTHDGVYPMI